nr:NADH dehydrogenase subunit 4L [Eremiaphila sp.]
MLKFFSVMFFCGLWVFCSKRKHLLVTLLSLEFIVLILFVILYFYFMLFMFNEMCLTMFFLSFSVCEGALGLSILVSMIRTHGNDYFNSFGLLQC